MHRFLPLFACLFLGLPGFFLWIFGMFATQFVLLTLATAGPAHGLVDALISALVAFLVSVIGFAMFAAADILANARRYRMASRYLPAFVALEFLFFQSVIATFTLLFCLLSALEHPRGGGPVIFGCLALLALLAGFACYRIRAVKIRKGAAWRYVSSPALLQPTPVEIHPHQKMPPEWDT